VNQTLNSCLASLHHPVALGRIFITCVLFFLALDLGVFHKSAHVVKFKEAIGWTTLWVTLSFLFGLVSSHRPP
jgi:hypothetical protein